MATATINFYPKIEKKSKKTGRIPVYFRICVNGTKSESKIQLSVTDIEMGKWHSESQRFITDKLTLFNSPITKIETKFNEFTRDYSDELYKMNAKQIKDSIFKKADKNLPKFYEYIESHYKTKLIPTRDFTSGTKKNYNKMFNHLKVFLKYRKNESLLLSNFTDEVAKDFALYLKSQIPELGKTSMEDPSARTILKCLKSVLGEAMNTKLLGFNPFYGIKFPKKSPPQVILNIKEVEKIMRLDIVKFPHLEFFKKLFSFQLFTGLNVSDANQLVRIHLSQSLNNSMLLKLQRKKTGESVKQVVNCYAFKLINQFATRPDVQQTEKLIPVFDLGEYNLSLKTIASVCELPYKLSSKYARNFYCQSLIEAKITDDNVRCSMVGWKRKSAMEIIYTEVPDTHLMEANTLLELYFNTHFAFIQ